MKDILIVGQAPSRAMQPGDRPFEATRALTLLAKYAGVQPRERLYELADFVNVIEEYPGPQPGNEKYDAFPLQLALPGMERIVRTLVHDLAYPKVIVCGSAARDLLGSQRALYGGPENPGKPRKPEWFVPYFHVSTHDATWYCSPHPGGTSMWWNDPKNRNAGTLFWRNVFKPYLKRDGVESALAADMPQTKTTMFRP